MITITPKSVNSSVIAVTNAATSLYDLMDTAGSVTNSSDYYRGKHANAVLIQPEDGDIRFLFGANPTSDKGTLLEAGDRFLMSGVTIDDLRLIYTGEGNVACSVQLFNSEPSEASVFSAGKVSLDASKIQIGAVSIQDSSLTEFQRITKELKKITLHLQAMTDEDVTNLDI